MRFVDVTKSYGNTVVMQGFSADLQDGAVHCILGPSGCGKTTFLRLVLGLEQPDQGLVEKADDARCVAVFQEDRLCENLSISANIRLPHGRLDPQAREVLRFDMERLLDKVGLAGLAGRPVHALSGGMKRRVALLRAVMTPSSVIVFDEPLKGLDGETKRRVMEVLEPLLEAKTVLWVTHDPADQAYFESPYVWTMSSGALRRRG